MHQPYSGKLIAKIRLPVLGVLIGAAITLGGCATNGVSEHAQAENKNDPYENVNRKIYHFNDTIDDYLAAPVSEAYNKITPQFMRTGVFNFFSNLKNINIIINDALQAKFAQSARDTGRFALNSTLGLAGFVDVAKDVGLEQNNEDFEQTLAVWGVPQGSYLVIPLLGPSTVRGVPGSAFDAAANPSSYLGMPVNLISLLNTRANAEGSLKFIDEASLDPYVFTRESFLQWRNNLATDGKSEASLDVDDELDADVKDTTAKGVDTAANNKTTPKPKHTLHLLPPPPQN